MSGTALNASQMWSHFILTTNLHTRPWRRVLPSVHAEDVGLFLLSRPFPWWRREVLHQHWVGDMAAVAKLSEMQVLDLLGYWIKSLQWFLRIAKFKTTDLAHLFLFREMTWRLSLPLLANCSKSGQYFVWTDLFPSLVNVHFSGRGTKHGRARINRWTKAHGSRKSYMQRAGTGGAWVGESTGEMVQTTRHCSCFREHLIPEWRKDT